MKKKILFIIEFVASGGFNKIEIPSSLFCEGYGMLKTIIADFKKLGFNIQISLDSRLSFLRDFLKADSIDLINENNIFREEFERLVKECEYCFIIAPEFSHILEELTGIAQGYSKKILSIGLKGISLGTSKINTYNFFKNHGVTTPITNEIPKMDNILDIEFIIERLGKINAPVVIKPEDGVGAESIFYFETELQIKQFFKNLPKDFNNERKYILQEFIEGKDLSVSLIGLKNKPPILLSINSQDINIKNPMSGSEYLGGHTPFVEHDILLEELTNQLDKLDLSDYIGYFGIDFIRKEDGSLYFIEINPRLTTSYIGIQNILDQNVAGLIFQSTLGSLDNIEIKIRGFSAFTRLELNYIGNKTLDEHNEFVIPYLMKEIPEIITPPISLMHPEKANKSIFSCFISTKEDTLASARSRLEEIKRFLERNDFVELEQDDK